MPAGEYLYGFQKSSRLFPTITFVLYYGEKEWNAGVDMGKQIGENRFAKLTRNLIKDSRTDDLLRAVEDKDYREQLYLEYKIYS